MDNMLLVSYLFTRKANTLSHSGKFISLYSASTRISRTLNQSVYHMYCRQKFHKQPRFFGWKLNQSHYFSATVNEDLGGFRQPN